LNLYLGVLGRRPDGYHRLETLFLGIDWNDEIAVTVGPGDGVVLRLSGEGSVPSGEGNLVVRAARAFLAAAGPAGRGRSVSIRLAKRLPVGAGLGGGSADAAAVLRALATRIGGVASDRIRAVARDLGADVPFFLDGVAAVGRERGDEIEPLPPPPPLEVVLVLPPFGLATASVFAQVQESGPPRESGLAAAVAALATGEPARIRAAHRNDLLAPACAASPEFARFHALVETRLGRPPCLTGSGSTLYDLPDPGTAAETLRRLEGLPGRRRLVRSAGG
jgi:4-diphosphocytidyl-2-C-methyl-D-erythritol kinase